MAKEMVPMAVVSAPGRIEIQDRPLPQMGAEDVKIRVRATSICGSDLHIFKGKHPSAPLPVPVGHEISGEVVAIGSAVSGLAVGDPVAVEPVINCGRCHYCTRGQYHLCTNISFQYRVGQGGFTPYFVLPARYAHKLPAGISFAEGALVEPLSVAVHAVKKAGLQIGDRAAVFGAGALGMMVLMLLRLSGNEAAVVDVNNNRLAMARELGAVMGLNNLSVNAVDEIVHWADGLGVDTAFEVVGLEITLRQALQAVRKGGRAVVMGLFETEAVSLPANLFVQKEICLCGTQGYNWDFQDSIVFLRSGAVNLKPLITHQFPLKDVQSAFDLLMTPGNDAVKVVVRMD